MYNFTVVYKDADDAAVFNFATSWRFNEYGFLEIHWDQDDHTVFIAKDSIKRISLYEVQQKRR